MIVRKNSTHTDIYQIQTGARNGMAITSLINWRVGVMLPRVLQCYRRDTSSLLNEHNLAKLPWS